MHTFSHLEPRIAPQPSAPPELFVLAGAFTEFITASSKLEASYEKLQGEVTYLSHELADRNLALKASLAENERVHRALQQILQSMPCGVLVVEANKQVSMINPEGRRLLDWTCSDDLANTATIETISHAAGIDLAGFLKRQAGSDEEQEFCRVSGNAKRWLSVHDRCLVHEDATVQNDHRRTQTILILRDITLHKQAEEERERARKATALAEVTATLAHEIRNPLASMELFAGLIASGGDDSAEWVSHLHAGIRSLAGTVNNVLSFHGSRFPALAPLQLCAALRSSVDFAKPIADQSGILLSFTSEDDGLYIQGNSSAMQQLVLNLVSNAIRHTQPGGTVEVIARSVTTSRGAQVAQVEFRDTGEGIPAAYLNEIFRPGFSGSGNSSGLGLAVCWQIVLQHEGTIRVETESGAGTTFFVEIPTV